MENSFKIGVFFSPSLTSEFYINIPPYLIKANTIIFNTNYGQKELELFINPEDKIGLQGAFLFFDLSLQDSYKSISILNKKVQEEHGNLPTVVCVNKIDFSNSPQKDYKFDENIIGCFTISVKEFFQEEEPILCLLSHLAQKEVFMIEVISNLHVSIPEISTELIKDFEDEIAKANTIDLLDDFEEL